MIFVFGGAYQGKLEFAKENFNLNEDDIFDCSEEISFECKVLYNFEKYILFLIENNKNPADFINENLCRLEDKIIIMNDISNGVVPISKVMRKWREEVGRCMVLFSKKSSEVYRVYCGIDTKLK